MVPAPRRWYGWPLWLVVVLICPSWPVRICRGEDPGADVDRARIEQLIDQLGSSAFEERESALRLLRETGQPARGALLSARNHPSPEVRRRVAMLVRQLDTVPLQDAFRAFAAKPDSQLDLEEGMWLISRITDRDAGRVEMARELDALAESVRKKLSDSAPPKSLDPQRVVSVLREVLFQDEKFTGNVDDYSNPDNSSLHKVLKTRKGLPILLSHVTIAVGRRLDLPIVGVPAPGRYLVKYDGRRAPADFPRSDMYLDPFAGGRELSRADRQQMFPGVDPDRMVPPQSPRDDLIRMLNNLETHLFNRDEIDLAYMAVAFRVALQENDRPATNDQDSP